jgi:hypothetical protein
MRKSRAGLFVMLIGPINIGSWQPRLFLNENPATAAGCGRCAGGGFFAPQSIWQLNLSGAAQSASVDQPNEKSHKPFRHLQIAQGFYLTLLPALSKACIGIVVMFCG